MMRSPVCPIPTGRQIGGGLGSDGRQDLGDWEKEIWTSAGISAGMDLMLWYVAEIYGKITAREVGRRLEYEWRESVGEGEVDPYYS